MNDWDDLEGAARELATGRGPLCGMAVFLTDVRAEYGEDAHGSILRTLRNHRLTTASIHKALAARIGNGIQLPSVYTMQRHRAGRCMCKEES